LGPGNQEVEPIIQKAKAVSVSYLFSGNRPKNRQIPAAIKARLGNAKGTKCPLCPNVLVFTAEKSSGSQHLCEASPDHILDLVLGGNNAESNFIVICNQCNRAKNHAMQNHLKTTSPGTNLGTKTWRVLFRSKPENIVKLFDYIDWSYRLPHSQKEQVDSTLQGYFDENRFRNETPPEMHETSIVDYLGTPAELSDLERRIQRLENTLWKRTMRTIGKFFQRVKSPMNAVEKASIEKKASKPQKGDSHKVEKASIEKQAPQPQKENPHNPDFTPEEFSSAILQMSRTDESEFFGTSYGFLLEKQPRFNLSNYNISPNEYLLLHCSFFLEIEDRPDKLGQNHYWISPKNKAVGTKTSVDASKIIENSRKTAEKRSQEKSAEIRRKSANTNTHAIQNSKSVFDLAKWLEENWRGESTYPKLSKVILAHEEENKGNRTLKDILKEDFDIPKRWTMVQKTEHWNRLMHSESFRQLIFEIFSENETDRLSLSALGVRLNRKAQDEGHQNSKEYFQSVHGSRMTISDALNRYFTNEEIRFTGIPQLVNGTTTMKYTHVELHRRN
jgi:5-methylcytosine-specific restriction endonuclease McrA